MNDDKLKAVQALLDEERAAAGRQRRAPVVSLGMAEAMLEALQAQARLIALLGKRVGVDVTLAGT